MSLATGKHSRSFIVVRTLFASTESISLGARIHLKKMAEAKVTLFFRSNFFPYSDRSQSMIGKLEPRSR